MSFGTQLRDGQEAELQPNMNQIFTLYVTIEQSIEMNSALYIWFFHHEVVIGSIDRESPRNWRRHHGIPQMIGKDHLIGKEIAP